MSHVKVVDSLENWFDVLLILGGPKDELSPAASALAERFSIQRRVYVVRPDAAAVSCRTDPDDSRSVRCPPAGFPGQAEALRRFLREARVRRPLIWIEDAEFAAYAEQAVDDFRVLAASAAEAAPESLVTAADMVIGESRSAVHSAIQRADFRGRDAVWLPSDGYDALERPICAAVNRLLAADKHLNILILYDDTFTHIKTIQEHLSAFGKHSRHRYFYFPVRAHTRLFQPYDQVWPEAWDLSDFDAVVWHYCLRAAHTDNIDPIVLDRLAAYDGLKVLFIQDDYDTTLTTWSWIETIGIHLVMTCIPAYGIPYAFPGWKPGEVEFIQTHTGFVPEDDMDAFIVPMEDRQVHLAYRGRTLPYRYGSLGREKYMIGVRMKELAAERGVPADIAVDEFSRVYGDGWYRFTASARATLASESGSHVFDFDGSLAELSRQAESDGVSYDAFYAEHLADREEHVRMNQLSPRIFEAIRLKTALVCFEGEYSGAILPHDHYIPLKKDFSNADEVFQKLADIDYLKALTERAYNDVIGGGRWSHARFVQGFDEIVQSRLIRSARRELVTAVVARRRRGGDVLESVIRASPTEYILNSSLLSQPLRSTPFAEFMALRRDRERATSDYKKVQRQVGPPDGFVIGRITAAMLVPAHGVTITRTAEGAVIEGPPEAWSNVAYAPLELAEVNFRDEHCWVRAIMRDVTTPGMFGAYNGMVPASLTETPLPLGEGEFEVWARVSPPQNTLLIRNMDAVGGVRCTFVRAEIVVATAYEPTVIDLMHTLLDNPSDTIWREDRVKVENLQRLRPREPAEGAAEVLSIQASEGGVYAGGGGQVTVGPEGALIEATGAPWTYAAALDFDLSGVDLTRQYCWIKLVVRDVRGSVVVSLWGKAENDLGPDRWLESGDSERAIFLPLLSGRYGSLLFRRADDQDPTQAVVVSAHLVVMSRYSEALLALVQELSPSAAEPEPESDGVPSDAGEDLAPEPEAPQEPEAREEPEAPPTLEAVAASPGPAPRKSRWLAPFGGRK